MNKKFLSFLKGFLVVIFSVVITTIAINATDNIGNFNNSLLGSVFSSGEERCPQGMASILLEEGEVCMDIYEASVSSECPNQNPLSALETRDNLDHPGCRAVSVQGAVPWRHITRHQALLACTKAGKRLPTNNEWFRGALGTPDPGAQPGTSDCYVKARSDAGPLPAGSRDRCTSSFGMRDMIGNVWEWVDEDVRDGYYKEQELPPSGFVKEINAQGLAVLTHTQPDPLFNNDYFWSEGLLGQGIRGFIRGGAWGNDTDAGYYSVNAIVPPSFSGGGVGFRCVK